MSENNDAQELNAPRTVEQMALNNLVNIEAMLDVLIGSGVVKEDAFHEAKRKIEKQIIQAQQEAAQQAEQSQS